MRALDHLVYATPDLEASVETLTTRLGVRPVPGGRHPGRGTRNALLGLGPKSYLEILGPDGTPSWFFPEVLPEARLVAWAARDADLEARAAEAARAGMRLGPIAGGSRQRPDGQVLRWRFTDPAVLAADGVVPFFIDWGDGPHPADGLEQRLRLVELRLAHPETDRVRRAFSELGLDQPVWPGAEPRITAVLETPLGRVEL